MELFSLGTRGLQGGAWSPHNRTAQGPAVFLPLPEENSLLLKVVCILAVKGKEGDIGSFHLLKAVLFPEKRDGGQVGM